MQFKKKNGIFVEDNHKMKKTRLTHNAYSIASSALIVVCTDALIIDRHKKLLYLACRTVKPMKGYWSIGGRRLTGENGHESVSRNFIRETSVFAKPSRFKMITFKEFIWKDRKEHPIKTGKHDIIQFFTISLSKKELEKAKDNLCLKEYIDGSLEPFDRNKMIRKKIHPALIELYDFIFQDS